MDQDYPPVSKAESGQKLLQFLERRLGLPADLLHRWIRTGQIRLNGKRCKPFARLCEGDLVRLPPFANTLSAQMKEDDSANPILPLPLIIGENDGIIAFNKPAGLPVQPGTSQPDSVSSRLNAHYARALFKPTPCHRLDKDTSGVLLVASSFPALKKIHADFNAGKIHKEYLVWTHGLWPWQEDVLLRHYLRKEGSPGSVRIKPVSPNSPYSKECICVARILKSEKNSSLLQILLLTGFTHQIRVQLAAVGYPVEGDGKYGQPGKMRLHAMRIILPSGIEFSCLPDWDISGMPEIMPPPMLLGKTREDILSLSCIS